MGKKLAWAGRWAASAGRRSCRAELHAISSLLAAISQSWAPTPTTTSFRRRVQGLAHKMAASSLCGNGG